MNGSHRIAADVIDVALLALPAGKRRHRYERELLAELHDLPAGRQLRYAAGTLITAWSLRRAAMGRTRMEGATVPDTAPRKPLLYKLNLHHHYQWMWTEDNLRYKACNRCGRLLWGGVNTDVTAMGAGIYKTD